LLAGILIYAWAYACSPEEKTTRKADLVSFNDTTYMAEVDFAKDIQPILQSHCSPCHFAGEKMYGNMPFDKPETIRDHCEYPSQSDINFAQST
jgi:hypothetical protein